jgi:hypothetical protein
MNMPLLRSRAASRDIQTHAARLGGAFLLFLCCILLLTALSGCTKKIIPQTPPQTTPGGQPEKRVSALDEARNAYVGGNYTKAEAVALRLVEGKSLSGADTAEAGRILAAAALNNHHPNVALTGLEHWRAAAKRADAGLEWQDAWCKALRALSSYEARTKANDLYKDAERPLIARCVAGVCMAVRQWQDGELGQSLPALENIYHSVDNNSDRKIIENRLALELGRAGPKASELAAGTVTDANRYSFPYNIILIDKLRRLPDSPERQAALADLRDKATLTNHELVDNPPHEGDIQIRAAAAAIAPGGGKPVVLLLPMSGQYAGISAKIVSGARAACGPGASLLIVDTEKADWVAQVDALPPDAAVIGGPIRRGDYTKAKAAGLLSRRVFLTFLASLDSGDEGRMAWRFYPSARDQVDTLIDFAGRLGISGFGVFYPDETFGRRMSSLFAERAKAAGARDIRMESYAPDKQEGWMTAAKNLLTASKGAVPFRAIFLPDSWKNMDVIVPNFFYYNETRQVLLGTRLWEQGLSGNSYVSMQYYKLAVFPGLWNGVRPTASAVKLKNALEAEGKHADFWSGLGYDFARLSLRMGTGQGWNPESVNNSLMGASGMEWSIAPISWSAGIASQRLFLFSPSERGFMPINEADFAAAYEEAWKK